MTEGEKTNARILSECDQGLAELAERMRADIDPFLAAFEVLKKMVSETRGNHPTMVLVGELATLGYGQVIMAVEKLD